MICVHRNVVVKPDRKSYLENLNVDGMTKLRESLIKQDMRVSIRFI
jgi:hypothetical protein